MQSTESYKSEHHLTLLFTFLLGALMTILYLPQMNKLIPEDELFPCAVLASLIFISSLLVSSLNGIVLLPCISLVFGSATAIEADRIRILLNTGEPLWTQMIVLIVLIPLFFMICSWGMSSSYVIRDNMNKQQSVYKRNRLLTYVILLMGTAVFAVMLSLIFI